MILLTFQTPDGLRLGVKTDNAILDVTDASTELDMGNSFSVSTFFRGGISLIPQLQQLVSQAREHANRARWFRQEEDIEYGPCVPEPGKVLCVGLNYRRHAAESGMAAPDTPVLFSKFNNAITAQNAFVPLADTLEKVDYEAELVVVIGKGGKNISQDDALNHVLGYCNGNDISERALQMLTGQWLLGKTLDNFLPMGPYLVTSDEITDPQSLPVRCWFNGELRQDSNTSDMIFTVAEVISYASQYMTLQPGDIISTGTPEGVILGMDPKVWMKAGDETIVEIGDGQFGKLKNQMIREAI